MSVPASCSSFYQRMRQSVVDRPSDVAVSRTVEYNAPVGAAQQSLDDTMAKLRAIASRRDGNRGEVRSTPRLVGSVAVSPPPPNRSPQPTRETAINSTSHVAPAPADGDGLSAAELASLRAAELEERVGVAANMSGQDGNFVSLCDEATVKVFPRHVVFARGDGSPVAELVVAELFELTEDDPRGLLVFHFERSTGEAGAIQVTCRSPAARSALYKLVCAKRNALEA
uniref:Uncharacterized protein n=1 Tax=Neobodo designis TaxID=312471 RepID=A0A7S1R4Y1_NEODS|mmetsp:Transcript_829/g.2864  ORF Transcript_829/g.2864 Transcript_829/m.2864 type:complete len:227 (+) Transcript_829:32-712(+)|eukprot:CAMPEP_0174853514 /NCGR_PEP_ID=MMETSP1114-20130205/28803_1 /TAXON_ID=312471 /ORGANISM="Neobodo designis, Strain CCAP 1951/1" /LENGTH=226 /DNA_ID=CAMNT_0016088169 /DNA_START=27 /DNA_END=707 /DNA_ORIENTATION=+